MVYEDSIFLSLEPRPTLFASFKYVGNAFDEDMARMAKNEKIQECKIPPHTKSLCPPRHQYFVFSPIVWLD